ncbi:MAG TPA: insulinase family protein [Allosphingosinicella sp.]|nr:insulinase family protein [Allosphingosinicella sp.]
MITAFVLAACSTNTSRPAAQAAPASPAQAEAAPLSQLVSAVDIPYQAFTLANGLRVIVHEDHKAPIVAVSVWYHIGSKDEPPGKTGFAHLFEHLMFYGSENAPDNFMGRLEEIGATDWNGTTWFDRTNYFETVPVGALDRALFLESDRMGHLLGAVTQARLDAQRAVVQNEKRMGDNEPGGLTEYVELAGLLPDNHPYRHSTIGSMADLEAASLEDVKNWFRSHYGPNNAVLVLAGDIDVPTARAKVERWFGGIPRGPDTPRRDVPVPSLAADVDKVMHDRVATVSLKREWVVPGVNDPSVSQLELAASILGGLGSSRLDNALVRGDKTAVKVSASVQAFEKISFLTVEADVKPGVDPDMVSRRLDAVIADFLKFGPTADEVQRAATTMLAGRIGGLENVGGFGGKAVTLAEGAVYSNDPAKYKKDLAEIAAATPESVAAAARQWMGRPVFRLTIAPGERSPEDLAIAGGVVSRPRYFRDPKEGGAPAPATPGVVTPKPRIHPILGYVRRSKIPQPPVEPVKALDFPAIERARLANGMKVVFARRATVPVVRVSMLFDAGNAADDKSKLGIQALMLSLLDEGTTRRNSIQIAQEQERLGASISSNAGMDNTSIGMFALKPNLAPSLDLLADIVRNPAFNPDDIERQRAVLLARIATEKTQPQSIALRVLPPLIYGTAHPYGVPFTGSGDETGVKSVSRDDLLAFHRRWIRPDNGTIFVVGDTSLAEVMPMLESRFGNWQTPTEAKGAKSFAAPAGGQRSRIILIDKPQSPQSLILAGETLPLKGIDDPLLLATANEVLGGSTTSRLATDLRETKGWAYFAGTQVIVPRETMPFLVFAPVQTDRTGDSIAAALDDINLFLTRKGITAAELAQTINSQVLSLPGDFEGGDDVMTALVKIETLRRPDDYYVQLPGRYRAMTAADLDKAARAAIDPRNLLWVVVGDAAKVRPQLDKLGMPVELMPME